VNTLLLQLVMLLYLAGILWLQRRHWALLLFVWQAFGLAFIAIHVAALFNWHAALAALESRQITAVMLALHVPVQIVNETTLLIPDATGWSGLRIGIESSTLIELAVLCGLVLFYPKQTPRQRALRLVIGVVVTYALNLVRLMIIIVMILMWGKPAVILAHDFVGRLVYFTGVVVLYWFLLTKPTVRRVYNVMSESGRLAR
jgi:exosortase/archaeosortase family protein